MKRNALALHEWKDLYNKGYLPDEDDSLKSLALDMIRQKDAEEGESWSNDTEAVAEIMLKFHKRINE
jgi:hypothetical protein